MRPVMSKSIYHFHVPLKEKCFHFDEIFVIDHTENCQFVQSVMKFNKKWEYYHFNVVKNSIDYNSYIELC